MKCATSQVHRMLDAHPAISMSAHKELNFFFGPDEPPADVSTDWLTGRWHRGPEWYAAQLDPVAPVRGESSPGYTDPGHPEVAARMARLVPEVRLVYLVRDPLERAVSQWRHHTREGDERRPLAEALLDPDSQYVARSRFHERIVPFLDHFPAEQLLIVAAEDLAARPAATMRRLHVHVGVPPLLHQDPAGSAGRANAATGERPGVPPGLQHAFWEQVEDDLRLLRRLAPLPDYSATRGA
jgi:hypothetical protein